MADCLFDIQEMNNDAVKLEGYRNGVLATVEKYGGRYLMVGGRCDVVEGSWGPVFPVLIGSPVSITRRWYDSAEYRDLKALRLSAARSQAVFMEGEPSELVKE
jgi:uncharacterized protein (DUF1330 family)